MLYSFFEGNLSGSVILCAEESHHLISVRRARVGEAVTLLDGKGTRALARIEEASAKHARLNVEEVCSIERPCAPIWLAQAMPLGKTMDIIVQKAAELGVTRIVPLCTERSELRLDAERTRRKLAKWRSSAVEAVKQCGNPFVPQIDDPAMVEELFTLPLPPVRLVCSLESGAQPLLAALSSVSPGQGLIVAIGPEGDFSQREYAAFGKNDFLPVTLGPLVLRADTAAIAALAVASEALRFAACPLIDKG